MELKSIVNIEASRELARKAIRAEHRKKWELARDYWRKASLVCRPTKQHYCNNRANYCESIMHRQHLLVAHNLPENLAA